MLIYSNIAGEYPKNLVEALPELQVSGDFTPFDTKGEYIKKGNTQGLYHLFLGQGQNAFFAKGNQFELKLP